MKNINNLLFVFVGGSCGSFVKTLISNEQKGITYNYFDNIIGYAHGRSSIPHTHLNDINQISKRYPQAKRFVLISYDLDDLKTITNMQFNKYAWPNANKSSWVQEYIFNYPTAIDALTSTELKFDQSKFKQVNEEILMLSYPTWIQGIDLSCINLIISFKEIMFEPPEKLINKLSNFLNHSFNSEHIVNAIASYRAINAKYVILN